MSSLFTFYLGNMPELICTLGNDNRDNSVLCRNISSSLHQFHRTWVPTPQKRFDTTRKEYLHVIRIQIL